MWQIVVATILLYLLVAVPITVGLCRTGNSDQD